MHLSKVSDYKDVLAIFNFVCLGFIMPVSDYNHTIGTKLSMLAKVPLCFSHPSGTFANLHFVPCDCNLLQGYYVYLFSGKDLINVNVKLAILSAHVVLLQCTFCDCLSTGTCH